VSETSPPTRRQRRRFFICFNAIAGRPQRNSLESVIDFLTSAGSIVTQARATTADAARAEATEAAQSGTYDAIVAAGGDGTIRQAAIAVAGTSVPLGIIPSGTGNVLAHEIALRRTPAAIAHTLLHGPTIEVELAVANGEPFLLMAGVGFDGRMVRGLNHRIKNWIGKAAYLPPGLSAFKAPLDRLEVVVDGRSHHATWAVIANARHFAGAFVLAPRTRIDEPGLQAVLFHARSRAQFLRQLIALSLGRLESRCSGPGSDVDMIPCSHVRVASSPATPVQIDGDDFGVTPLDIGRSGQRIAVIVPKPQASLSR
jgi:diacylglycerol kinase family enzyme